MSVLRCISLAFANAIQCSSAAVDSEPCSNDERFEADFGFIWSGSRIQEYVFRDAWS